MRTRKFLLASLALAVVAVGLHLTALTHFSRGAHAIAHAVTLSQSDRATAKVEASALTKRGDIIAGVGLACALASLIFLVISTLLQEPGWRLLAFAMLGFYIALQFVLV